MQIKNLSMSFGNPTLFENVNLNLKIISVGQNGIKNIDN